MFERATALFPNDITGNLSIGKILDAMLYYQTTEFIVDRRSFYQLWTALGADGLNTFLTHPSLECRITPEMPAVLNKSRNGIVSHRALHMLAGGTDEFPIKVDDTSAILAFGLGKEGYRENWPKINKLLKKVKSTRYDKIFADLPMAGDLFRDLISDVATIRLFLNAYALRNQAYVVHDLLNMLDIEVYNYEDGCVILSNVAPSAIVPGHFAEGWQDLLPMIHEYQMDLRMAQTRSADIICGDVSAKVSASRLDLSINRATKSAQEQTSFEQFAFGGSRPFGKAFEEGKLSLDDALRVIDQTAKFRAWLVGMPVDADVVREYHLAVSRETILDKLPGRTTRFAAFTGGGIALDLVLTGGLGTVAGLGLSAFDSFVLDSVIKGWKPNNFVETVSAAIK